VRANAAVFCDLIYSRQRRVVADIWWRYVTAWLVRGYHQVFRRPIASPASSSIGIAVASVGPPAPLVVVVKAVACVAVRSPRPPPSDAGKVSVSVPLVVVIVSRTKEVDPEAIEGVSDILSEDVSDEGMLEEVVLPPDIVEIIAAGTVTSLIGTPVLVYTHRHLGVAVGT